MKRSASGPPAVGLRWSASAVSDLEAILDVVDQASTDRSLEFETELLAAIEPLRSFPKMGRVPRDFDWRRAGFTALRELLVWDYRVGYILKPRQVEIAYLVHTRRHFPPLR